MTIGGWVLFIFICICVTAGAISIWLSIRSPAGRIGLLIACFAVCIATLVGLIWYFGHTESGKRAVKTQESNFSGGIHRSVRVYDAVGNLLQEYEGRFDVDFGHDGQRILFDDENGLRHVIYFKSGTVIVEEI